MLKSNMKILNDVKFDQNKGYYILKGGGSGRCYLKSDFLCRWRKLEDKKKRCDINSIYNTFVGVKPSQTTLSMTTKDMQIIIGTIYTRATIYLKIFMI